MALSRAKLDAAQHALDMLDARMGRVEIRRVDAARWNEADHPRSADGKFGSGGTVSENDWQTWAASGYDVNAAMRGTLHPGAMSSDGEKLTQQDVDNLRRIGNAIQAQAEQNRIPGGVSVFRGVAFETEAEMRAALGGRSLTLPELTSTGSNPEVASEYARHWSDVMERPVRAVVQFTSGNGMPGVQTNPLGAGSEEYVLPAGAKFTSTRYRGKNASGEDVFEAYMSGSAKPGKKD